MDAGNRTIYLDNAATTRCGAEIAARMQGVLTGVYGNPSSLHGMGLAAERLVEEARGQAAAAIGGESAQIVFTSGATEANNLAVLGAARARRRRGEKVVVSMLEHPSVLVACNQLESEGFTVLRIPPEKDGRLNLDWFSDAVDENTVLVSAMLVNNETGAVNDIAALTKAVRRKNPEVILHCDAVQALGKIPINVKRLNVDLLTVSAHKIYGPKGVGALYIRRGTRVLPILYGGSQQQSTRPGTENVAGICGFSLACEAAVKNLVARAHHVEGLYDQLVREVKQVRGVCINSPPGATPYICNLSVFGLKSETLLHFLEGRGVYVSSSSACKKGEKSHVLTAMGLDARRIDSAVRISFSHENTRDEVAFAAAALCEGAQTLIRAR